MSINRELDPVTAKEWGNEPAHGENFSDYPEEREELTIERIQEMLEDRQFKELKEE